MAGGEGLMATTTEPKLSKQDLSTLDVTKLTPLSPEVISNQATINIGTIGHVAHGKSTVVKALSGVQTVRFKNELERNITIKLGKQETKMQLAVEGVEMPVEGEIAMPCDDGLPTETAGGRGVEEADSVPRKKKNIRKKRENITNNKEEEYEVEKILAYQYSDGKHWYFVKWKGWKSKYNSWEPLEHLANSQLLVDDFDRKARESIVAAKRKQDARELEMETIFNLHAEINLPRNVLEKNLKKLKGFPGFPSQDAMEKLFVCLKKRPVDQPMVRLHPVLCSWALAKAREGQLSKLRAWEDEMNQKCTDPAPITVCNDVDLEGPPDNFNYINHYLPFTDVVIPSEPIFGCACGDVCSPSKGCCPNQAGTSFAYSSKKQLKLEPGQPIYECNSRCSCLSTCPNRVVQLGRKYPLCIFRTSNGCGWGVRAVKKIPKSSFVCEYVGEVITNDEAERRGREYDLEGRTYLFDLDYNQTEESECVYTVDAAKNGNVSHFINHSCDPNLQVYAVWIDCLDPNLPRLGLFSSRDIAAGEEVNFDYSPHQRHGRDVKHTVKQQCKCGSKMCKKVFLW